ncbi:MAG: glyoxalase/bleomycin resistance/extradiol dioxygenase family protein [Martelella sp.]|uniref:VOC family protein n=1 Tax=unclassified Martelella TaxID=2629616 RepID=UPI000C629242|nr:VOC family protein [Martelella sp.]MAU21240.1 glyoxalase/bleomycin resistance/extradiol dioxygenase family protein [Martelella sp.]|tara:strand:- start:30 stop:443 length:414 start_codon:yes stop_codon:yes gene_type:complete
MESPIAAVLETALYVDDLDAAEAFYGGVLRLEKISRAGDRHIFFRCGPGVLLIFNPDETEKPAAADALPVPAHGGRGQGHVCFRLKNDDFAAMLDRLNENGIAIESDFLWPNGARSIYFRDPAGNSLECAEGKLWGL